MVTSAYSINTLTFKKKPLQFNFQHRDRCFTVMAPIGYCFICWWYNPHMVAGVFLVHQTLWATGQSLSYAVVKGVGDTHFLFFLVLFFNRFALHKTQFLLFALSAAPYFSLWLKWVTLVFCLSCSLRNPPPTGILLLLTYSFAGALNSSFKNAQITVGINTTSFTYFSDQIKLWMLTNEFWWWTDSFVVWLRSLFSRYEVGAPISWLYIERGAWIARRVLEFKPS